MYLTWGHQTHESLRLCPQDYVDDLFQGRILLKPFSLELKTQRQNHNLSILHTEFIRLDI